MKGLFGALLLVLLPLRAEAYIYFYGGPVNDFQRNNTLATIQADLMNLENLLAQILGEQATIRQQFQRARALIGPAVAGTYSLKSTPDVLANIEPLLKQIAEMRAETEPEKMAQYFAQRQLQVITQIRSYEVRLAELNAKDRRQLSLRDRQLLQSEMRSLNSQIFATVQQQKAESSAVKAAHASTMEDAKRLREKRERIQKSFGSATSDDPTK